MANQKISELPAATTPAITTEVLPIVQGGQTRQIAISNLLSGGTGSAAVGFLQAGTGTVARTVQAKLRDSVSVKDFGATGDGVTDDTAAIQAAINSIGTGLGAVYFPKGKYLLSAALNITSPKYLRLYGDGQTNNDSVNNGSLLYCKNLTGYLFTYNGLGRDLHLEGLGFDGRNGAAGGSANQSTTWQGVLTSNDTIGSNLFVKNCRAWGSNTTTPMWALDRLFFLKFEQCIFSNWDNHVGIRLGGGLSEVTTVTLDKIYMTYMRQCMEVIHVTDCTLRNVVFESSVVAYAQYLSNVKMDQCYLENIGYDVSGAGRGTGITARSFGAADSPAITGNVDSAITVRNGNLRMDCCRVAQVNSNLSQTIEGIGRYGGSNSYGLVFLNQCTFGVVVPALFKADQTDRGAFEYRVMDAPSTSNEQAIHTYADARLVTEGVTTLTFSDTNRYSVRIDAGLFRLGRDSVNTLSAKPTIYPSGGQWNVGDVVERSLASQASGKIRTWRCTTAGTPGSWSVDSYTPATKAATSIAAAGTADFGGVLENVGDMHVWEVTGTADNTSVGYAAKVYVVRMASTSSVLVHEVVDAGASAITLPTANATYVLRITNSNAFAMNYYATLTHIGSM